MVFSSLVFLCIFLPVATEHTCPRGRNEFGRILLL
jgi:hypothetical protein